MAGFPFLEFVAACTLVTYSLETILDLRQYAVLLRIQMSPSLQGVVSEEKFHKSRSYSVDKVHLHFLHAAMGAAIELAVLLGYFLPWAWQTAEIWAPKWMFLSKENMASLVFLALIHVCSQAVELPFALWSTFVVESKHGFNKQTLTGFFRDLLMETLLMLVLGPPLVVALISIIQWGGPPWRLAFNLWLLLFLISVTLMIVYPILIAPLFNKFTPLPEGPLRSKIESLASSLKFPLKKLLVVDGSTRSAHSNAYLYGFFNSKRIVMYDTLLEQCKEEEEQVVAVIAHELGHWKLSHTVYSFASSQVLIFLHFAAYAAVGSSSQMFQSFGFSSQPTIVGLLLFQQVIAPVGPLLSCALNALSRRFEFQADSFAQSLGYATPLRRGLIKLQEENLGSMATDSWYSTYHYSHPTLVERLAALGVQDKKDK